MVDRRGSAGFYGQTISLLLPGTRSGVVVWCDVWTPPRRAPHAQSPGPARDQDDRCGAVGAKRRAEVVWLGARPGEPDPALEWRRRILRSLGPDRRAFGRRLAGTFADISTREAILVCDDTRASVGRGR